MSTLYIMCGLPFSGKTTLARAVADQGGCIHLDLDAIAREKGMFPEEGMADDQWGQVFREVYQQVATLLASGKSVVFDAVNYDRVGRDRLRAIAHQVDSSTYIIFMDIPPNEIAQRRHANQQYRRRPPTQDDDFVKLTQVFDLPDSEEPLLLYDGRMPIPMWIKHYILGAS